MRRRLVALALLQLVLAGCAAPLREPSVEARAPPGFPEQAYREAAAEGQAVYRIERTASLVVIEVRRGGPLARLGHDHVVASHDVGGYALPGAKRADVYVPLTTLSVDEPGLRAEAHFDTQPSADDIAATRRNMRERVLDVGRYPFARIAVRNADAHFVDADVTLHGATREYHVPVQTSIDASTLDVAGEISLRQTDFGIVPLSVLGGAVQVEDRLAVRFTLRARRVQ
jgi:polyisoprenoid-binding protein YceI